MFVQALAATQFMVTGATADGHNGSRQTSTSHPEGTQ